MLPTQRGFSSDSPRRHNKVTIGCLPKKGDEREGRARSTLLHFLANFTFHKKKELTRSNCFHHLNYLLFYSTFLSNGILLRCLPSRKHTASPDNYCYQGQPYSQIPPPPFVNSTLKISHLPAIVFYEALV